MYLSKDTANNIIKGIESRNDANIDFQLTSFSCGNMYVFIAKFTRDAKVKYSIQVCGEMNEIIEIISDTELKLKKSFSQDKAITALSLFNQSGSSPVGTEYKLIPNVDQSEMFNAVTERLVNGGCVGIFPEGGSHDRSDFLPLKPGVVMMALGAMSQHEGLDVKIVPCGLNYFHADKVLS